MEEPLAPIEHSVIFTIGRFNPPTSGHKELLKNMIRDAVEKRIPRLYIIASDTLGIVGDKTNPLECEEKRRMFYFGIIQSIIDELKAESGDASKAGLFDFFKNGENIEVLCMNDEIEMDGNNKIMGFIGHIMRDYRQRVLGDRASLAPISLNIYLGSDEVRKFDWINGFLPDNVTFEAIGVSRVSDADMSSTFVKNLTIDDPRLFKYKMMKYMPLIERKFPSGISLEQLFKFRRKIFIDMYVNELRLDQADAIGLYEEIKERLAWYGYYENEMAKMPGSDKRKGGTRVRRKKYKKSKTRKRRRRNNKK